MDEKTKEEIDYITDLTHKEVRRMDIYQLRKLKTFMLRLALDRARNNPEQKRLN